MTARSRSIDAHVVEFCTAPHDISAVRMMVGMAAKCPPAGVVLVCSKTFLQLDELDDERDEGCRRSLSRTFER